jgi:putative flippase GtrA
MRRWWSALPVLAGLVMIMGVIWLNGSPSVFTDTDDYFVEGRTFAYTIAYALHVKTPPPPPTDPDDIADAKQAAEDLKMSHTEIGARSPYYGLLLYGSQRVGTIWLTATLQATVGAWLAFLFWRVCAPGARWWTAYIAEAAIAFASTLPFFAGFTMPDVFSGYVAMSAVLMLVFWDRLKAPERWGLGILLSFAMSVHTSHVLDCVGITALAGLLLWRFKPPKAVAALAGVSLAIVGAVFATWAYKEAVQIKTGDEMRRPPFLAMRVLADGPGREYLRAACAKGATYVLCHFRNLPLDNSQDLLWSDDRKKGIFNVTTFDNRLQMEREENAFVLHAVLYDPIGQVFASVENWGEQLFMIYLDDPLKNPHYYLTNDYWSTTNLPWLINHARDCGRDHWGCGSRMSIDGSTWLYGGAAILGLLLVGLRLGQRDIWSGVLRRTLAWEDDRARLAVASILLLAAVIINAFVCGALSGPFPRYQARITWLITAAATMCAMSLFASPLAAALPRWIERIRAIPLVAAVERRIDPKFLRFGMVGTVGFIVDAAVLHTMVGLVHLDPFRGQLIAFAVAVTATWLLNRTFTFRHATAHGPVRQAALYLAVQGAGGLANFAVYAGLLTLVPALTSMLLIPLAFGAGAGLCLTFAGSKYIAFKAAPTPERIERPEPIERAEAVEARSVP